MGRNRPYNPEARFLTERIRLVKRIKKWVIQLQLTRQTCALAISFLDVVLASENLGSKDFVRMSSVCLLVATKLHEVCEKSPKTTLVYNLCKKVLNESLIQKYETFLCQTLNWELDIITPVHFVIFYLSKGVIFDRDKIKDPAIAKKPFSQILRLLSNKALNICIISLNYYQFYQHTALAVAASAIAMARTLLGFQDFWCEELQELTWVKKQSLEPCIELFEELINSLERNDENSRNLSPMQNFVVCVV